ncbi:hypothetical protein Tco_0227508 [Tanacetum coccineum]
MVTNDSKWDEMDKNDIANLHLALVDGFLSSIEEKKSERESWHHLARLYEARSLHNKKNLKWKLYALRMTESTSMTEQINNLNTIFSQRTSLSYYLVFDDVAAVILEEENRRNNREDMQMSSRQVEALAVIRGRSMESSSSGSHDSRGDLMELSAEEAWETIEDCAQCNKQWKTPTSTISDQSIANLKAKLVGNEMVRVKIPRCMSWLGSTNAYDEPISSLGRGLNLPVKPKEVEKIRIKGAHHFEHIIQLPLFKVTDNQEKDKIEAKTTKPSTGTKRA